MDLKRLIFFLSPEVLSQLGVKHPQSKDRIGLLRSQFHDFLAGFDRLLDIASSLRDLSEKKVSPDLSGIVQEVIDLPGWSSGNSMVVVIEGFGERTVESYDGESENAPLLVVTYVQGS